MANVAIVTSTAFGGSNGACFQAGLISCLGDRPHSMLWRLRPNRPSRTGKIGGEQCS
jgi:hypothetical protein